MSEIVELVIGPVAQYAFMRVGLAAAVVVGVTSAVLSCLLVVRGQALLGDAISHAVLLGVVLGYLVGGPLGILWGAMAVAVATGAAISYVARHAPIRSDAAMGILFTFTFALGLAIVSVARPRGIDLFHVLFGNVLGVTGADLALTAVTGGVVVAVVLVGFRAFHLWSFDPQLAKAMGMRTGVMEYVFVALLSAAIVASLQTVGIVLVVAMLVTPGATAALLTSRLSTMMAVAAVVGLISGVAGLYGSFYLDVASGPAIVIVASACFAAAFFLAPRRGVLAGHLARRGARDRAVTEDLLKALAGPDGAGGSRAVDAMAEEVRLAPSRLRARLRALARQGAVRLDTDAVALTERGREQALKLVRAHRLLERYLHEGEGVPLERLHGLADGLEHTTDEATLRDLDRLMGAPERDPHGHPIPTATGVLPAVEGATLTELAPGVEGLVVMVADDRDDLLARLVALGLVPDQRVRVVGTAPRGGVRVRVTDRDLDVAAELADRVLVRPD